MGGDGMAVMTEKSSSNATVRKSVMEKLSKAVQTDLKKDKLQKSVDRITVDDGIISVRFSLELPREAKKGEYAGTDYKNFTKNFKTPEECSEYLFKEFFNETFEMENEE